MSRSRSEILGPGSFTLLLVACAGEPAGDSAQDTAIEDTAPDRDAEIQAIWTARCVSCHGDGMVAEGLDLTDGHAAMVGVAAAQIPEMALVEPGAPDESFLWYKLNDTQLELSLTGLGEQMPLGSEPLTADQLAAVEAWILDGAPD